VSGWVTEGDGFLSGHLFSLSAFGALLLWPVQSRFADGACLAAGGGAFESVRARFPSTEDILEQCGLCCVLS